MTYNLRPFRRSDARALAEITVLAIRGVGTRRYSAEQVEAWAARHPGPERFLDRASNGDWIAVAVGEDDTPVAYVLLAKPDAAADIHGGHLDMLYCHPDHTRKGLANRLLSHAEDFARSMKLTRMFTEASELAKPAFERAGYSAEHRRDFEIDGVPIHNYAMAKRLI